ncbi:MAG: hypothetical protein V4514_14080 [Pseudomonadota bacterium]|uniref:hypothetical protein n=1 Tax=unclassified Phenylobacterium TaxID=2640670 RepID=UPI0012E3B45B|nr:MULTISPECIES: hypothetical protein [unclassified Phenylobacterium]MBT9470692.1 hypothetical protein [Phenylobacterium sp.]
MSDYFEDILGEEPDAAVVRWMDRPPLNVGAAALSTVVAGAFLLGAVAAFGLVALSGRFTTAPTVRNRISRLLH